jgi:predicted nucleotidyltransferase
MRSPFPTPAHQAVAEAIVDFFRGKPGVDAVLLVNSCARSMGTPESDLDLAILVDPTLPAEARVQLEQAWRCDYAAQPVYQHLRASGRFTGAHLDLIDARYESTVWDDGGGPDGFELEIGNQVAYSLPLWEGNRAFADLKIHWLPYYNEALRQMRLTMVRAACLYDLEHVSFYVNRGLYFQAFDRLYKAFQEFLQALFISRRVYPLAYNKWIRLQVAEWLGLPELYAELPGILSITHFESAETAKKADDLRRLVAVWVVDLPIRTLEEP